MRLSPLNLQVLAYTLEVEGFDVAPALRRCGLTSPTQLDEEGEWVPIELYDQLIKAVLEENQDPAFGLIAGKSLALMRYGAMTPVSMFTPTLRHLLKDIERFAALVMERAELRLEEKTADAARIIVEPIIAPSGGASHRFRHELVATSVVQMLRFAGVDSGDVRWVDFPYACPPGMAARYASAFGQRIRFNHADCAVSFNPASLDHKLATHDPVAYTAARTRAESALSARRMQSDTAEKVRQWMLAAFPHQATLTETARHLGMSERSLRRRLSTLGTNHQDLAQECQHLKATQLLAEGRLSLKQIADGLGFSSVTSFHRAFKRWTGITPITWRDEQSTGKA